MEMETENRELNRDDYVNVLRPAGERFDDDELPAWQRITVFRNALIKCEQHGSVRILDKRVANAIFEFPSVGREFDYERRFNIALNSLKTLKYMICHSDVANGTVSGIWDET